MPMQDATQTALKAKAVATIDEALSRLREVQEHLGANEELAALGALSGIGQRLQYVETLLTVLRDVQPKAPNGVS